MAEVHPGHMLTGPKEEEEEEEEDEGGGGGGGGEEEQEEEEEDVFKKWLMWFHAVMVWSDSLMMFTYESKHVGLFSVTLQYKSLRKNTVQFVGLLS
jgi:hypothetical protein